MEVELIKANDPFDGSARRKIERLRVAAYCRVSTDDEDQIKSYNSMVTHYTELIQNNKDWIFSGIYADKAITGTSSSSAIVLSALDISETSCCLEPEYLEEESISCK